MQPYHAAAEEPEIFVELHGRTTNMGSHTKHLTQVGPQIFLFSTVKGEDSKKISDSFSII